MTESSEFPGLDYDFLRYMGVKSEVQRQIQSHYLPYFEERRKVLDLACGDADFVALLHEKNIDVTGVDSDPKAVAEGQKKGLPVFESDVFEYLKECDDSSFDGIFCAHLVEHLPYPLVIQLVQEAYRVLEPGGIIVLATPNARALISHLEMFYMHYDHVNFYHPKLLCFFLEHEDFVDAEEGVNPATASPLMAELNNMNLGIDQPDLSFPISPSPVPIPDKLLENLGTYHRDDLAGKVGPLRKFIRSFKDAIAYLFVRPYVDRLAKATQETMAQVLEKIELENARRQEEQRQNMRMLGHQVTQLRSALSSLNGPFECYALAYKPTSNQSHKESIGL
ncbi:MAG: class I SAM-dependent methyltransferase [Chloroflexota bacterium]